MIAHPTYILKTTRSWSRRAGQRLNQSLTRRKGEPKRRKAGVGPCPPRIVEPGAKSGTPSVPVESEASLLLVILHYLLKNNTEFMMGYGAGQVVPWVPSPTSFYRGQLM